MKFLEKLVINMDNVLMRWRMLESVSTDFLKLKTQSQWLVILDILKLFYFVVVSSKIIEIWK